MAQCKAKSKQTGEQCKRQATTGYEVCYYHGANPNNKGGAPKGNKNALKTGEREAIWLDTLSDEERALYDEIDTETQSQLVQEIKLTEIRERRMMKRIADLQAAEFTVVSIDHEQGYDAKGSIDKATTRKEATLGQIQRIEEALTRVQVRKAVLIELWHKLAGADDDGAIDGLIEALQRSRARLKDQSRED